MSDPQERLAVLIDELDSLCAALGLPIPDAMHVQALRDSLPANVQALKAVFVEVTGENPWG